MAAFEVIVRHLCEWKLAILAVPSFFPAWLICKFCFWTRSCRRYEIFPTPPRSLFLGNLLEIKQKGFLNASLEWSQKYGGMFVMWLRPGTYFWLLLRKTDK